jgi:hypothetical protein
VREVNKHKQATYKRTKIRREWLLAVILTVSFFVVICSCTYFAAGSYPFVERYVIDTTEEAVIEAVNIFKTQHGSYVAPEYLEDGRKDNSEHWYHIYFYLPEERFIVHCWTRPESKTETAFAFVGINEGTGLGNWKRINSDLTTEENKRVIEIFERRLLKPIKASVRKENRL